MKIEHLGAKNCVTGSCHLVQTRPGSDSGVNILVDCGKAYGNDPELAFDRFPVLPRDIGYLFLTHAHIDHIGRVPDLIDAGFHGEIICTHATKALLIPMLHDALSFTDKSDKQVQHLEKTIDELSWGFEYNKVFALKKGINFKFGNAGHILGSCFIRFSFPRESAGDYTVIFSGDLGCTDTPILPDPDQPDACDLLVLESTYGDRNHTGRKNRIDALNKMLHKAMDDKGIVYIPAFSLGRTQELIYELDRIRQRTEDRGQRSEVRRGKREKELTAQKAEFNIPVFIDSPLGLEITKIYSALDSFWDKEAKALKTKGDHPIDFKNLYSVERFREHKKLLNFKGPAIIIAGSGMCTGGRILDHLECGLDDPKNDIFFVGYQAKGTLGRRIIDKKVPVKAGVYSLTGYSAHADQSMLVNWVKSMPEPPGEIRLVHGEAKARQALSGLLNNVRKHGY